MNDLLRERFPQRAHPAELTSVEERQLAALLAEVAELKKYVELPEYAFRDSDSDSDMKMCEVTTMPE